MITKIMLGWFLIDAILVVTNRKYRDYRIEWLKNLNDK